MISLENLSSTSKKLLYIQNMRALLRKESFFSDGTDRYVIPAEPEAGEEVKIRFRTAKANADFVYLCIAGQRMDMKLVRRTELFDYYEAVYQLGEQKADYYFEIRNKFEYCYYDKLGPCNEPRKGYEFSLVPDFPRRNGQRVQLCTRSLPIAFIMAIRQTTSLPMNMYMWMIIP